MTSQVPTNLNSTMQPKTVGNPGTYGMVQQSFPQNVVNQPPMGTQTFVAPQNNPIQNQPPTGTNLGYATQVQAGRQTNIEVPPSNYPTMATGKKSQKIQCPYCGRVVVSQVKYKSRGWSLVLLIILAIIFFPLILLYILCPGTFCPGATHYCPSCGHEVGRVYKWC